MRRRISIMVLLATAAGLVGAAIPATTALAAQPESPGCEILNDAHFDALYSSSGLSGSNFTRGEVVTLTAGYPTLGQVPTSISIFYSGPTVPGAAATAQFPGTAVVTLPAGVTSVVW